MTSEILDRKAFQPSADIKTTGVFNLSRSLSQDEYNFLQTGIKSKFKRDFLLRKGQWFDFIISYSERSEDLLTTLSFVSYVGRTFIKLDTKGILTPEQATSAIRGLEELFALPIFNRGEEPVHIAFGSATFRIGDTEFYRVYTDDEGLKVQSGELVPIWNDPIAID